MAACSWAPLVLSLSATTLTETAESPVPESGCVSVLTLNVGLLTKVSFSHAPVPTHPASLRITLVFPLVPLEPEAWSFNLLLNPERDGTACCTIPAQKKLLTSQGWLFDLHSQVDTGTPAAKISHILKCVQGVRQQRVKKMLPAESLARFGTSRRLSSLVQVLH